MTDDVHSKSSTAVPGDTLPPKKPRARKTTDAVSSKQAPVRRGERAENTRPRNAVKGQKTEPAAKQRAKKPSSEEGEGSTPRAEAAISPQASASDEPSSPVSVDALADSVASKTTAKKKTPAKRKSKGTEQAAKAASLPEIAPSFIEDPIGDVSDGEARIYTSEQTDTTAQSEAETYRADVAEDAINGTLEAPEKGPEFDQEAQTEPEKAARARAKKRELSEQAAIRPPAKLERLQKILSQAGIASRRRAEEMIVAGRVAVNGQVVTALGSKADPERDHIRVDGKLLHGAERHRYFVLNKPKAYVTTVSDPQGRPTVMEFVSKLAERVYPVGRLDFQSEGLLLMTNDGALANQLTHASSGVEKTYLVKISGQPDEEELERLRNGVMIERGDASSSGLYGAGGRVRTAPARIRQIRPGENPWYEVVLTEGRNREIRKMFSAIGHYVEKIRRVGYGPLVLDIEPGQLRELTVEEVDLLRQASEGKLKSRRLKTEAMLPKEAGRAMGSRPVKRESWRTSDTRPSKPHGGRRPEGSRSGEFRPRGEQKRGDGNEFRRRGEKKFGSGGGSQREFRGERREWQPRPRAERRLPRAGFSGDLNTPRQAFARPREPQTGKPAFDKPDFGRRGEARGGKPSFRQRSEARTDKPDFGRRNEAKTGKPQFRRSEGKFQKPEDRESRNRPNRPSARWQSDTAPRPFRAESRTGPGSSGKSRPEASAKFTPKGGFANRYPQRNKPDFRRGKPEVGGREHSTDDRSRGRDRFSSNRKPGHSGPRPSGHRPSGPRSSGPRPGGHRPSGKRRG